MDWGFTPAHGDWDLSFSLFLTGSGYPPCRLVEGGEETSFPRVPFQLGAQHLSSVRRSGSISCALILITFFPCLRSKCNTSHQARDCMCMCVGDGGTTRSPPP